MELPCKGSFGVPPTGIESDPVEFVEFGEGEIRGRDEDRVIDLGWLEDKVEFVRFPCIGSLIVFPGIVELGPVEDGIIEMELLEVGIVEWEAREENRVAVVALVFWLEGVVDSTVRVEVGTVMLTFCPTDLETVDLVAVDPGSTEVVILLRNLVGNREIGVVELPLLATGIAVLDEEATYTLCDDVVVNEELQLDVEYME